ncbi:MAG: SLBB domain-containing protein [Proteobacteria bacterium]|nr:SLBB domain-containing protein [Pseudomonadota bacterium]
MSDRIVSKLLWLMVLSATPALASEYRLGAGDTIDIEIYGLSDMGRSTQIPSSCEVDIQLIGPMKACGLTTIEFAETLRAALATGYLNNPHVLVDITQYGSQTIDVIGQVKKPGLQALTGPTTLTDALASAGGPSSPSVLEGTVLTADGRKVEFYLPDLRLGESIWLSGGDVVQLREPLQVHVSGQVAKPGPVAFRDGLTVTEALSMTGGPTEFAALRRTLVVRADGSKIRLNVRRIAEGRDTDILLRADDRIVIKQSIF